MSVERKDLLQRLNALLPELKHGRETHVQWRDCDQVYRDENPDIGDREFHSRMVKVYDERIATVKEAARYITNTPTTSGD